MTIEKYHKTKGGKPYYNIYFRFGKVCIRVDDIQADSEDKAVEKIKAYLYQALFESNERQISRSAGTRKKNQREDNVFTSFD